MSEAARKPYPSDVSGEEWAFVAPYLTLLREDAEQREPDLREVFNALRWIVRTGTSPTKRMDVPGEPIPGQAPGTPSSVMARGPGPRGAPRWAHEM
jgi:hypothetical protein